jgi:hypothetical protein
MPKILVFLFLMTPTVMLANTPADPVQPLAVSAQVVQPASQITLSNSELFPDNQIGNCAIAGHGLPDVVALAAVQDVLSGRQLAQVCQTK